MKKPEYEDEERLCERLGVSREIARGIRDEAMNDQRDWTVKKGRVVLSPSGVKILEERLKAAVPAPKAQPELVTAVVTGLTTNQQVFYARVQGLEKQRVFCRDTANFIPGMEVPVRHRQADLWEYVGRLPRWRGRI